MDLKNILTLHKERIMKNNKEKTPKPRGFAALSPEARKLMAKKGGKAAHAKGTAHRFTAEEAVNAGRKGGRVTGARKVKPDA